MGALTLIKVTRGGCRRHGEVVSPSGNHYPLAHYHHEFEAQSQEDYEWLLTLKVKGCAAPRPRPDGMPVFQAPA